MHWRRTPGTVPLGTVPILGSARLVEGTVPKGTVPGPNL